MDRSPRRDYSPHCSHQCRSRPPSRPNQRDLEANLGNSFRHHCRGKSHLALPVESPVITASSDRPSRACAVSVWALSIGESNPLQVKRRQPSTTIFCGRKRWKGLLPRLHETASLSSDLSVTHPCRRWRCWIRAHLVDSLNHLSKIVAAALPCPPRTSLLIRQLTARWAQRMSRASGSRSPTCQHLRPFRH